MPSDNGSMSNPTHEQPPSPNVPPEGVAEETSGKPTESEWQVETSIVGTREFEVFISFGLQSAKRLASDLKRLLQGAIEPAPNVFVANAGGIVQSNIGYRQQITNAMRSSKAFIGIITKDSANREWILFEGGAAWGRNVLYSALMVGPDVFPLPVTIGDYQATNATSESDVRGLIEQIAQQLGYVVKPRFGTRYAPFQRTAQAYPDDPTSDSEPEDTKEAYRTMLIQERYQEADALLERLKSGSEPDLVGLAANQALFDSRLKTNADRLALLTALPASLLSTSAPLNYWLATWESRAYVKLAGLKTALALKPDKPLRRLIATELADGLASAGAVDEAMDILHPLMTGSGRDRTEAAAAVAEFSNSDSIVPKLVLRTVAAMGDPREQDQASFAETTNDAQLRAMSLFAADRSERKLESGHSANQLGIALAATSLNNLAVQAYQRSVDRGISVSKVNIAALMAGGPIAATGLKLLADHSGAYDSASAAYPYSMRAQLEATVQEERIAFDRLVKLGRQQVEWLLELVEPALMHRPVQSLPSSHVVLHLESGEFEFAASSAVVLSGPNSNPGPPSGVVVHTDGLIPNIGFIEEADHFTFIALAPELRGVRVSKTPTDHTDAATRLTARPPAAG